MAAAAAAGESGEGVEGRGRSRSPRHGQGPLTQAEVEAYHREGWLIPAAALPAGKVERLRATLERLLEENPGVRPERLVSAHLSDNPSSGEGVKGSDDFLELAFDPCIVDVVAQLLGPDLCLWGCQVFCKPGGDGMEVPMHQDGHYWPIRPLATATVWVALDECDSGNGCLKVVPGSHLEKRNFDHFKSDDPKLVLSQAIKPEELGRLAPAVDVALKPGQFSVHDVFTVHGSNANTSGRRRAGVAFRYMPTTSVLERDLFKTDASAGFFVDWGKRPLFLIRGCDRSGRNTMSPLPAALDRIAS